MLGEARGERRELFSPAKIRMAQSIGDQSAIAIRRMLLQRQTERRLQNLTALREIDQAITSSFGLHLSLSTLLTQVIDQLSVDAASVWLFNSTSNMLEYSVGRGFRTTAFEQAKPLRLGEGYAGRAALEGHTIHITNLAAQQDNPRLMRALVDEEFVSYFGIPLIARESVQGVLEVFHRTTLEPDEDWLGFLDTLAGQAAIAIDNATLFDNLLRSNYQLNQAYDATIEGWSAALDLRDKETEGHTQRVTKMTVRLAKEMGFSKQELVHVRRGALLHDIGKMGVPDRILLKPDKLTDDEWIAMRKHPEFAYNMLSPIHYLQDALDIPYCHHEKWDGTGYPRGLKGEQIPLTARIFAIVDVWDAITSNRPYRAAWSREKALEHIRSLSGSHFDPQVAKKFVEIISED
jgi:putative nucleotidyltransferase with HDIG domain